MDETDPRFQEALKNCDREAIHTPAGTQDFGVLLATDSSFTRFEFLSGNAAAAFNLPVAGLLGAPVETVFNPGEIAAIRLRLDTASEVKHRVNAGSKFLGSTAHEMSVHQVGGRAILELIPSRPVKQEWLDILDEAMTFLINPDSPRSIQVLLEYAVERFRYLTGFSRIKAYRFLPDYSGEVVAEALNGDMPSFLGLRFPAHDIPPVARKLYASTPLRVICDTHKNDTTLLCYDGSTAPLDMSLAILRGTSPVHNEYLRNMDVRTTMTIPISVNGELWGLFAFHNRVVRTVPAETMALAELAGRLISLRVQHLLGIQRQINLERSKSAVSKLSGLTSGNLAGSHEWEKTRKQIMQMIPSDGVVLSDGGKLHFHGSCPGPTASAALFQVADREVPRPFSCIDLADRFGGLDLAKAGGALVISGPEKSDARIAIIRDRTETIRRWAGAPQKDVAPGAAGPQLTPRKSYETYIETVSGKSDEWTHEDLGLADALREALATALTRQQTSNHRESRFELTIRDLNTRVVNILKLIRCIAGYSHQHAFTIGEFDTLMDQPPAWLGDIHEAIARTGQIGIAMDTICEAVLRKTLLPGNADISWSGPPLHLKAEAASILALVLGELAANARATGLLSGKSGTVSVQWCPDERGVSIEWADTGGTREENSTRNGIGNFIVEKAIGLEFRGRSEFRPGQGGASASFWLPAHVIVNQDIAAIASPLDAKASTDHSPSALVVEDNPQAAKRAEAMLLRMGFATVVTASTIPEAIGASNNHVFDFCLLDVDVGGTLTTTVARNLGHHRIPFAFLAAKGSRTRQIADSFPAPVIQKPLSEEELGLALADLQIEF